MMNLCKINEITWIGFVKAVMKLGQSHEIEFMYSNFNRGLKARLFRFRPSGAIG